MHNYEWEIFYNDEVVGYLTEPKSYDMFWCTCKIIPKNGFEKIVLDKANWNEFKFKYFNVKHQEFCPAAIPGSDFVINNNYGTINMRSLGYLESDLKKGERNRKIIKYVPLAILVGTLIFVAVYSYIKFHGN